MACSVLWTEQAQSDVDTIIRHTALVLASPQAAREHLAAFEQAAERMGHNPELYALSSQPSCAARHLRACFVKRYVLLYSSDGQTTVIVHRVFSTLQDYASIITDTALL